MSKVLIFVDFWNFQLNWNKRFPNIMCNWINLPKLFYKEVKSIFNDFTINSELSLEGIRIYASINQEKLSDVKLRKWLTTFLNSKPGFTVSVKERHAKESPVVCSNCKHKIYSCPECGKEYLTASEKGVDSAIITDMFALHIDGVYDIAIIVSADSDMVPMVKYLQNHNVKVLNAAWKGHGFDLKQSCWASFNLDTLSTHLTLSK